MIQFSFNKGVIVFLFPFFLCDEIILLRSTQSGCLLKCWCQLPYVYCYIMTTVPEGCSWRLFLTTDARECSWRLFLTHDVTEAVVDRFMAGSRTRGKTVTRIHGSEKCAPLCLSDSRQTRYQDKCSDLPLTKL